MKKNNERMPHIQDNIIERQSMQIDKKWEQLPLSYYDGLAL